MKYISELESIRTKDKKLFDLVIRELKNRDCQSFPIVMYTPSSFLNTATFLSRHEVKYNQTEAFFIRLSHFEHHLLFEYLKAIRTQNEERIEALNKQVRAGNQRASRTSSSFKREYRFKQIKNKMVG